MYRTCKDIWISFGIVKKKKNMSRIVQSSLLCFCFLVRRLVLCFTTCWGKKMKRPGRGGGSCFEGPATVFHFPFRCICARLAFPDRKRQPCQEGGGGRTAPCALAASSLIKECVRGFAVTFNKLETIQRKSWLFIEMHSFFLFFFLFEMWDWTRDVKFHEVNTGSGYTERA